MDGFLAVLTMVAALGCGLNAGVFFAFSSFVMKALARLQPAQGIAAMQSISGHWLLAGSALYLVGTIGLTRPDTARRRSHGSRDAPDGRLSCGSWTAGPAPPAS
jgi:uncharacterized membrane protein